MTDRKKQVLELRFGLIDGQSLSQKEISQIINVIRARVGQIEEKALPKLRHPNRRMFLEPFKDFTSE